SEDLLGADMPLKPLDDEHLAIRCTNKDASEAASFIHQIEHGKHSFQEFVIEAIQDKDNAAAADCQLREIAQFKTDRCIQLGMSISELTELLGDNFKVDVKGSVTMLNYTLEGNLLSAFLQYYNALSYHATYSFKHDKLIKIDFGLR